MDVKHRKIVNIETAPVDTFSVKSIGEAPFYHANQYETLKVVETFNNRCLALISTWSIEHNFLTSTLTGAITRTLTWIP